MNRCILIVPLLLVLPLPVWACSGPGAREAIRWNTLAALALFLAAVAATVFTVFRQRRLGRPRRSAVWLFAPVLLHPGWWMSSMMGDCGITRFHGSVLMTGAVLVLCFFKLRPPR
jgi:hypothetical protein